MLFERSGFKNDVHNLLQNGNEVCWNHQSTDLHEIVSFPSLRNTNSALLL